MAQVANYICNKKYKKKPSSLFNRKGKSSFGNTYTFRFLIAFLESLLLDANLYLNKINLNLNKRNKL